MAHRMYLFGDIEQIMEDLQREYENAARLETLLYNWLIVRKHFINNGF